MIVILPFVSLAIGVVFGHWLGRGRRWMVFGAVMFALVALFALGVVGLQAQERTGFDGVAEAALLVLGLAPLAFGGLVGAAFAMVRNRRDRPG